MEVLNKRASGILLHITSLPSEFGIGDMGKAAFEFTDFLKRAGQQYWQILPLNPTDASKGFSPYACYSAFAGNPLLVSPVLLYEEGLIKKTELAEMQAAAAPDVKTNPRSRGENKENLVSVDYKRVSAVKNKLFNLACNNFMRNFSGPGDALGEGFNSFCLDNDAKWLEDFACFAAFRKYFRLHTKTESWAMWPQPIRDRSASEVKKLKKIVCKEIELQKFLQFMFFKQWKNLKHHANSNGISIFGDVPIYVSHESSDVWSYPSVFKLDSSKMPLFVAGVPPDYYSKTGQLWNNPVYDWEELKKTGFSWWIDRMEFNFDMFDLVRLDHFRGFIAYWEVPAKEKTAMNGRWVHSYPDDFFNLLNKRFGHLPIVAENLGVITPDVDAVMEKFGFPGLQVLQFAFGRDFPDSGYLPHNYVKNSVAYTGTHDNNTLRGWLENEARAFEIKNILKYLGKNTLLKTAGRFEDLTSMIIVLLVNSAANLVIMPMQDILGLGKKARMNRPSTSRGNWKWQMGQSMLSDETTERLAAITLHSKRY